VTRTDRRRARDALPRSGTSLLPMRCHTPRAGVDHANHARACHGPAADPSAGSRLVRADTRATPRGSHHRPHQAAVATASRDLAPVLAAEPHATYRPTATTATAAPTSLPATAPASDAVAGPAPFGLPVLAELLPHLEGTDPDAVISQVQRAIAEWSAELTPAVDEPEARSYLHLQPRLDGTGGRISGELDVVGLAIVDDATAPTRAQLDHPAAPAAPGPTTCSPASPTPAPGRRATGGGHRGRRQRARGCGPRGRRSRRKRRA
jgi:hypothetical protein